VHNTKNSNPRLAKQTHTET